MTFYVQTLSVRNCPTFMTPVKTYRERRKKYIDLHNSKDMSMNG